MDGKRPDRPQEAQKLGLTDSMWDMTVRCWHQDSAQRPTMPEVVVLLRELLMPSHSIKADLGDFFRVCRTQGKDGQGEKAQEFADMLDEVRHTERHNIRSPHYISRFSTMRISTKKTANNI